MNNSGKLIFYRIFAVVSALIIVFLLVDRIRLNKSKTDSLADYDNMTGISQGAALDNGNKSDNLDLEQSKVLKDSRKPDYDIVNGLTDNPLAIEYTWTSFETLYYATICYSIDRELYEYYKNLDRYYGDKEYIKYITDPINSEYIDMIAENILEISQTRGYSDWECVREAINFVQSFEYVADEDNTDRVEWPKYPIEMLYDREGDCEDASILLAGVLNKLGYGTCLIKYDNHMAVGIKGDDSLSGKFYTYENINYYYIEATNTGWNIGDMPDEYIGVSATIIPIG